MKFIFLFTFAVKYDKIVFLFEEIILQDKDYHNCIHIEEGMCQLYHYRPCVSVNHDKLEECIFKDKNKFIWGNPEHEKALILSLEYFLEEKVCVQDMTLNDKILTVVPNGIKNKRHKKVVNRNPLDGVEIPR